MKFIQHKKFPILLYAQCKLMVIVAVPTAPPEQLSAIVTADSLVLMWSPPPFEQTNGLILYYALTITELDTGKVYTSISASVVTEISDLHPYYTYHCAIAAYTIGLGPYSDANFTVQLKEKGIIAPLYTQT